MWLGHVVVLGFFQSSGSLPSLGVVGAKCCILLAWFWRDITGVCYELGLVEERSMWI